MICLRCGYCCKYPVAILIDPDKGEIEGNILFLDGSTRCPHLEGNEPGKYSCKIHEHPNFQDTPCAAHSQFETRNTNCRLGEFVLKEFQKGRLL
jgi:hypothetical protein